MKHFKPMTPKAELLSEAMKNGNSEEVIAMSSVVGCTTTYDPGWEVGSDGGLATLCQPMEADLYGCSDSCWWPTQVPDTASSYKNWSDKASSSKDNWREYENTYSKK